jgi:predicted transposase YbfD/YdcC
VAAAAAEPADFDLPYVRSAIAVKRTWTQKAREGSASQGCHRIFLSSLPAAQKLPLSAAVRGHWSIENRNHWKRDASQWQEDDHRHRRPNAALNLALTRNALLALMPFQKGESLDACFDKYRRFPPQAIKLLLNGKPLP